MTKAKSNMKFELLTGKKLRYNVAESNVLVTWFVLKDFNIITNHQDIWWKINWKDLKGNDRDVTRPLQEGAGKIHNTSKRVKPLIFKAGHLPNESLQHYRYNDAFDSSVYLGTLLSKFLWKRTHIYGENGGQKEIQTLKEPIESNSPKAGLFDDISSQER